MVPFGVKDDARGGARLGQLKLWACAGGGSCQVECRLNATAGTMIATETEMPSFPKNMLQYSVRPIILHLTK